MIGTIIYCVIIFICGAVFGMTFVNKHEEEKYIFDEDTPVVDSFMDHKEFDPLNKAGVYLTDVLLEELCQAVNVDEIELPSFGTISLKDAKQLKQVYWRAVDVDETVYVGNRD
jgi:hypothetical protein